MSPKSKEKEMHSWNNSSAASNLRSFDFFFFYCVISFEMVYSLKDNLSCIQVFFFFHSNAYLNYFVFLFSSNFEFSLS